LKVLEDGIIGNNNSGATAPTRKSPWKVLGDDPEAERRNADELATTYLAER
jgi:hypothetical protein